MKTSLQKLQLILLINKNLSSETFSAQYENILLNPQFSSFFKQLQFSKQALSNKPNFDISIGIPESKTLPITYSIISPSEKQLYEEEEENYSHFLDEPF